MPRMHPQVVSKYDEELIDTCGVNVILILLSRVKETNRRSKIVGRVGNVIEGRPCVHAAIQCRQRTVAEQGLEL